MKRFLLVLCFCLTLVCLARATQPSYINYGTVNAGGTAAAPLPVPMIDAANFINYGTFSIKNYSAYQDIPALNQTNAHTLATPFTCSSVQNWTNRSVMNGNPGFLFDYEPATVGDEGPSANFVNANLAPSSTNAWIYAEYLVHADASNVVNSGSIESSSQGWIRLSGMNVDVSRGSFIQDAMGTFHFDPVSGTAAGIYDGFINLFWSNTNRLVKGEGINPFSFPALDEDWTLVGAPYTPGYSVITNLLKYYPKVTPPIYYHFKHTQAGNPYQDFEGGFQFSIDTNDASWTVAQWINDGDSDTPATWNSSRQVLMVHNPNTNVTLQVASIGGTSKAPGYITVVWTATGTNSFAQPVTNSIVLSDKLGPQPTNILTEFSGYYPYLPQYINGLLNYTAPGGGTPYEPTFSPTNYNIYRYPGAVVLDPTLSGDVYTDSGILFDPDPTDVGFNPAKNAAGGNPTTFFAGNYTTTNTLVTNYISSLLGVLFTTTNVVAQNPYLDYNQLPGRVELCGTNTLNLNNTRIDALDYLLISGTNHFFGNTNATISVPYSDLYLGSTNGTLTVSKMYQPTIPRLSGEIDVYSALWTNFVTLITNTPPYPATNYVTNQMPFVYNVILVDSNLKTTTPSETLHLGLRSTNLFIGETFDILEGLSLNATRLTILNNGQLNLMNTNSPLTWVDNVSTPDSNPLQFTNYGGISSFRDSGLYFLNQDGSAYQSFVNSGKITANGVIANANYFENRGAIVANTGAINIQAGTGVFAGGSLSTPLSDVFITCSNLYVTNLALPDGRGLWISAYTSLRPGVNNWQVHDGFNLLYSPTNGDFRSVTVTNTAFPYANVQNQWDGIDKGNVVSGYTNNGAVGYLILDGGLYSQFTFSGTHRNTTSNALYVDRLDFKNYATNTDASGNFTAISIQPGMKIYFNKAYSGNTLITAALNNKHGVDGTNGGTFVQVNDPASIFSAAAPSLNVSVAVTNLPVAIPAASSSVQTSSSATAALISWNTVANATNSVYFKNQLTDSNWQLLTNFVSGPQDGTVTISDPANVGGRFYQVRLGLSQ